MQKDLSNRFTVARTQATRVEKETKKKTRQKNLRQASTRAFSSGLDAWYS